MSDGAQDAGQYVGRTIGGRFQLQSLLGAGGMASVYLAYDTVLDRQVAVKTLHSDLGREQSFRDRFRREAQSVAKLTHTNIVSVFDSGEDEIDGAMVPYIVMEYVEGKPLRSVLDEDIAQYGAMPAEKALKITSDVLSALEVSHEMGLVHRDIKPGNVMLTRRGVVKVMDFGIARAMQSGVTSMTQTGMVVGTPQYLSPEQALGRGVDARSDLYSVGIMLFELLTGRLPFDADSPLAIAYAHVQEEAPSPSAVNQSLTPGIDGLVRQVLRKNPNERFATAESMNEECRRTGSTGAAPSIVSGPVTPNSGAGVGQAVFPPVAGQGQGTPPPGPGQQPYQGQFGSFGPSTPPPAAPAPMPHQGYPGAPAPYGSSTPPPYAAQPGGPAAGRNSGGKNNTTVIVSSVVAAIAVITVLVIVLANTGPGQNTGQNEASGSGETSSAQDNSGSDSGDTGDSDDDDDIKPEDKSKTIESRTCTSANEFARDKTDVSVPNFKYKNLDSVKKCIKAAGWKVGKTEKQDENVWGKNAVLDQDPSGIDEFNPKEDKIDLTVSTGKAG